MLLKYLHMVHNETTCLTLPLNVVLGAGTECHRAVLCGTISNLSIKQITDQCTVTSLFFTRGLTIVLT